MKKDPGDFKMLFLISASECEQRLHDHGVSLGTKLYCTTEQICIQSINKWLNNLRLAYSNVLNGTSASCTETYAENPRL